jgi:8-oxo-dGTP pyrophosphatase MutT (NUDIX family)
MLTHFGVYALILTNGSALLVRKTRGPYEGLLDLPGGAPEAHETDHRVTLARELDEETGLSLKDIGDWCAFEFQIEEDSRGRQIDFHHRGVWTLADVEQVEGSDDLNFVRSEDTQGCVWITTKDWCRRTDLSALVREVFEEAERQGLL